VCESRWKEGWAAAAANTHFVLWLSMEIFVKDVPFLGRPWSRGSVVHVQYGTLCAAVHFTVLPVHTTTVVVANATTGAFLKFKIHCRCLKEDDL